MTAPPRTTVFTDTSSLLSKPKKTSILSTSSSISLPTIASAPDIRQIDHPPNYASRLSSLRAVLRSKFHRTKPGPILKETTLTKASYSTEADKPNGLLIAHDSQILYYAHMSSPGKKHHKRGVEYDIHFHESGVLGRIVGAVDTSRKEFCVQSPGAKDVQWLETRQWWPGHEQLDTDMLYAFPIDPEPFGVDTAELQTPAVRFRATGEKFLAAKGRWRESVWMTKWGNETFFYPGRKTLIWKWSHERSVGFGRAKAQRMGLVLVDLENTIFGVFFGKEQGVVRWHKELSVQQEKAALLVLCHRLQ